MDVAYRGWLDKFGDYAQRLRDEGERGIAKARSFSPFYINGVRVGIINPGQNHKHAPRCKTRANLHGLRKAAKVCA